jgi:dienelactone hydrolase
MRFAAFVSLALLAVSHITDAQEKYRIPVNLFAGEVRGPYKTGTFEELWIDEQRDETTTKDPSDKRHLMVQIWYPAELKGDPQRAPYAFHREFYANDEHRRWLDDIKAVRTTSVLNANLVKQPERFPVLIYNPGGGHPPFSATFQTEFLASHGYIVVAVGHTGMTGIERFPDGYVYQPDINNPWLAYASSDEVLRVAEDTFGKGSKEVARIAGKAFADLTDMDRFLLSRHYSSKLTMPMQVQDIRFALDKLQTLNGTRGSRFHQRLDLERVGSLGWSIGGALSITASRDEPRIKAAANIDGWLYTDVPESGTNKPIMQMFGSGSAPNDSAAMRELGATATGLNWQLYKNTTADWYHIVLNRATHGHFSDRTLLERAAPEQMHPRLAHDIVNRVTLEFFDKYLRQRQETPLLSGAEKYPEVELLKKPVEKQ